MLKTFLKNKICSLFKNQKGYSIFEMLIVVLIFAVVATAVSMLYISSSRSQRDMLNKAVSETALRTTMFSIAKDIRGATLIIAADSSSLKFETSKNTIEYEITSSGSTYILNKIITSGESVSTKFVMENIVDNNVFSYYLSSSEPELPVPLSEHLTDFKLVNLNFTVNKEPLITAKAVNLSTTVYLRNR